MSAHRQLSDKQILDIYTRAHSSESSISVAASYGLHENTVSRIKNGDAHSKITGHARPERPPGKRRVRLRDIAVSTRISRGPPRIKWWTEANKQRCPDDLGLCRLCHHIITIPIPFGPLPKHKGCKSDGASYFYAAII